MSNLLLIFGLAVIIGLLIGIFYYLKRISGEIMSAIDNLKTAVDESATTTTDGFAKVADAFTELADDISKIPQNADVQAEADRLAANTTAFGEAFVTLAQRLRDAVPTDAPEEPLPLAEPTDA